MGKTTARKENSELNQSDKLALFVHRMTELTQKKYYRLFSTPISTQPLADDIDEELFISFLVGFRHFYLTESPTEMGKIHNILKLAAFKLSDEALRGRVEAAKTAFDSSLTLQVEIAGKNGNVVKAYRGSEILSLFLNSRYFHTDVKGLQFFFQLPQEELRRCRDRFPLLVNKYVVRLKSYVPLAFKVMSTGIFPKGFLSYGHGLVPVQQQPGPGYRGAHVAIPSDLLSPGDVAEVQSLARRRDDDKS